MKKFTHLKVGEHEFYRILAGFAFYCVCHCKSNTHTQWKWHGTMLLRCISLTLLVLKLLKSPYTCINVLKPIHVPSLNEKPDVLWNMHGRILSILNISHIEPFTYLLKWWYYGQQQISQTVNVTHATTNVIMEVKPWLFHCWCMINVKFCIAFLLFCKDFGFTAY